MKVVGQGSAAGSDVLLIHGSATDRSTWAIQLASLSSSFRMMVPNRPGADGAVTSVEDQAAQLLDAASEHVSVPFVACGSSFGAIVALEMARRFPERLRGLVLIEPPLPPHDSVPAMPRGFGCRFDATSALVDGERAAEMFLRLVLGDESFDRIPKAFRARSVATWRHIRADSLALSRYRVNYRKLRSVRVPTLLLGGERSNPRYASALDALEQALPNTRRETIPAAGHMLHAESAKTFNRLLGEFVAHLGDVSSASPAIHPTA